MMWEQQCLSRLPGNHRGCREAHLCRCVRAPAGQQPHDRCPCHFFRASYLPGLGKGFRNTGSLHSQNASMKKKLRLREVKLPASGPTADARFPLRSVSEIQLIQYPFLQHFRRKELFSSICCRPSIVSCLD